jgi:hypothetical protein
MKRTTYISKGEKLWPYIIKSWKSFLKTTFEIVSAYYITISQINDRIIGCLVLQPVTSKQLKLRTFSLTSQPIRGMLDSSALTLAMRTSTISGV